MHMQPLHRRTALAFVGLATLATSATSSAAVASDSYTPTNWRVVLENETGVQPRTNSSASGTGQTASHSGQFVVFATDAALVPSDTNGQSDVYMRDLAGGITILVSARNGRPGNDISSEPTISADGRYVAFTTWADDLTAEDTNGHALDVVVKDMQRDKIELASVTSRGKQKGRNSFAPTISDDGRSVSFQSFSSLGRLDEDRTEDVYVRDLDADVTHQASVSPKGRDIAGPLLNGDISADGDRVVFGYRDDLYVRHVDAGRTVRFWQDGGRPACNPHGGGTAGRPVISGNGRYAAFSSCDTDLPGEDGAQPDIYRVDLRSGDVERTNPAGNGDSYLPSLSCTGRYLGFGSEATDLVAGDDEYEYDAFRLDMETGTVLRVSEAPDGAGGNARSGSNHVAISGDGQTLVYVTYATNLVENDTSDHAEVLVWRAKPADRD